MNTKRRLDHPSAASRPLLLAVMALAGAAMACKLGGSSSSSTTGGADQAPATGVEPGAGSGDLVRYAGLESADTGTTGIRQVVQARRAADWSSTPVATLYPGTVVTRVARYGNYSLVSWTGASGAQQGWVDSGAAFSVRWLDGGVAVNPGTAPAPVFGTPTNPTIAAPTATTPPPPVAAAPPPTVAPPPPPVTVAPPPLKPPPATTATTKGGFKPPKLGK